MPSDFVFDPDVFHGELTANRAQIFVRVPRTEDLAGCTLHGFVHGPRCEYAHTLPAKFTLIDLGPGPTLLARATITDPCLWTSDLPQIYDVHIEVRRHNETIATEKRMIGLRGIGGRASGQIVREGKTWVPRGVAAELVAHDVARLREELLVGIVAAPPLDFLVEASRQGGYLIAEVAGDAASLVTQLRSFARWPAVMLAIIRGGQGLEKSLQQVAPNLVLAQAVRFEAAANFRPAVWANAIVVESEDQDTKELASSTWSTIQAAKLPVLVQRTARDSVADPRAECDRLQRDLARIGQFAGYLIAGR